MKWFWHLYTSTKRGTLQLIVGTHCALLYNISKFERLTFKVENMKERWKMHWLYNVNIMPHTSLNIVHFCSRIGKETVIFMQDLCDTVDGMMPWVGRKLFFTEAITISWKRFSWKLMRRLKVRCAVLAN